MRDQPLDNPFGPDSMLWRICRHRVTLLYGPAAAVLQVAHPRIALGVHDHSDFQSSPIARLNRTLDTVYTIAFGSSAEGREAADRVAAIHNRVTGDAVARDVPGPAEYSAFEPDLLLWVIATMIMSAVDGYEHCVQPLSDDELDHFYRDMRTLGSYFALPANYGPHRWPDFLIYWQVQLDNPTLGSHSISRQVARAVALPSRPLWLRIGAYPLQFMFSEILPSNICQRLGFRSTRLKRLTLTVATRVLKLIARFAPDAVRFVPQYSRAIRRLRRLPMHTPFPPARSSQCAE